VEQHRGHVAAQSVVHDLPLRRDAVVAAVAEHGDRVVAADQIELGPHPRRLAPQLDPDALASLAVAAIVLDPPARLVPEVLGVVVPGRAVAHDVVVADPFDDVDNPRVVKRANPSSWVTVDQLRAARASLPDLAHRRFVANQWTERVGHWLPPGAWDRCVGEPSFEAGARIWAAIDVGGERSATALAWLNEDRQVGVAIFHGEAGILEAVEAVHLLAETYRIAEITYDPMRAVQLGAELAERGITASAYPQSDSRMIPASERLRDAIVRQRLVLPDEPELRRHAANAVARQKPRGWRIEAPDRSSNVDAIVALAMALDRLENRPTPTRLVGWL
jgi:hypothetical protein